MNRPRLRHLAFVARDAAKLASFYVEHFGMEQFHQEADGSRFLTDGYLNLAIIQQALDGEVPTGFNHFGFHVEDADLVRGELTEAGHPAPASRMTNRPFAEYRGIDPEGNWFDISAGGFVPPHLEQR
ncbi:VOC family protein [Kribbella antibiotica]|uniref:VOC family protein n=1 Tax=Kribbella antibiotica TaxID=190195 RepID=A0A4R4ZPM2_9ACTN|nr:VOC family protein [Kribbella antibiotica]TDD58862.1 VOC family protein [Kribbella antibiotica]